MGVNTDVVRRAQLLRSMQHGEWWTIHNCKGATGWGLPVTQRIAGALLADGELESLPLRMYGDPRPRTYYRRTMASYAAVTE